MNTRNGGGCSDYSAGAEPACNFNRYQLTFLVVPACSAKENQRVGPFFFRVAFGLLTRLLRKFSVCATNSAKCFSRTQIEELQTCEMIDHDIQDPDSLVSGTDMVQDITYTHTNLPEEDSDLVDFYKNSTVFITGATGFLGKLCMEKLLRTVPDINRIYILIRPKKGKEVNKRFDELFDEPSFDPLKRKFPEFRSKIHMVMGDVGLPGLGLSEEDKEKLVADVDCIFHFAATVRFDEKIRLSTHINVRGVRDILRLAKHMKKLRAFVHVSTAFSNCVRKTIEEKFYDPPITGEKLINLVDCLDEDMLEKITPTILGDYPNTYAFTKCIAEEVVKTEGKSLPVALYRPSIVIATVKEPVSGWIDNVYGATGVLLGVAVGLLRVLRCRKENKADMVPADYVINSCLATAWDIASMKTLNNNKETQEEGSREEKFDKEIPVYNFVSTPEQPMTWEKFQDLGKKHAITIPSDKIIWRHVFFMIPNKYLAAIMTFLLHTVPAYIVDFIAMCLGKKPMLVKGYQKINKFAEVIAYFASNEWNFKNDNIRALWGRMKPNDRQLFEFSMQLLDWNLYFYTYTRGARVYLIKDELNDDSLKRGRSWHRKLVIAHYLFCAVLCFLLFKFLTLIIGLAF